jgi:peptide subunit release factor 1 (eRF1)
MHAVTLSPREMTARIARLRSLHTNRPEIVSVYLNTEWSDEHQRDRTRVFLRRELTRARAAGTAAPDDLDWIEQEGLALVEQAKLTEAHGIALFACHALGVREAIPVRLPFEETLVVDEHADLRALLALIAEHTSAMIVFVDGDGARLIPLHPTGAEQEVRLEHTVSRRHRRGGWAQLAQSRYARHIEAHRHEHFAAVADAVTRVIDAECIEQILLAGHEDRLSAFREHLPERIQRLVIGHIHAAFWEQTSAIVRRATERLDLEAHSDEIVDVDDVLTEAAKAGRAVAGVGTLEAARRGAIHRLYMLASFCRKGRECVGCGALQETGASCWLCGTATREIDLATALVDRVVTTGGAIEKIVEHAALAAVGGIAARLRYPLRRR